MRAPTLGGNHGFATGVNNRSQIVGGRDPVHDPTCTDKQVPSSAPSCGAQERGTGKIKTRGFPLPATPPRRHGDQRQRPGGWDLGRQDQAVGRWRLARRAVGQKRETGAPRTWVATWHTPMDINGAAT
jgi:hypothetical protein